MDKDCRLIGYRVDGYQVLGWISRGLLQSVIEGKNEETVKNLVSWRSIYSPAA